MKKTRIRKESPKRRKEKKEYYALVEKLLGLCSYKSELSGLSLDQSDFRGLLYCSHHIEGRNGTRYLDVTNILICTHEEHEQIHKHNTWERKQELLEKIKPIRKEQGFKVLL